MRADFRHVEALTPSRRWQNKSNLPSDINVRTAQRQIGKLERGLRKRNNEKRECTLVARINDSLSCKKKIKMTPMKNKPPRKLGQQSHRETCYEELGPLKCRFLLLQHFLNCFITYDFILCGVTVGSDDNGTTWYFVSIHAFIPFHDHRCFPFALEDTVWLLPLFFYAMRF